MSFGRARRSDGDLCFGIAVGMVLVLAVAPTVRGAQPDLAALLADSDRRWYQRHWTVEDGLPANALSDVVATPDGWLWIASYDGLIRFDGLRFTRFDSRNEPALRSNRIPDDLVVDRDGTLWIRSEVGHLTRYTKGRFHAVGSSDGTLVPARLLTLDADGRLLVGTDRGVARVVDDRFVPAIPSFGVQRVEAVASGPGGRLWWVNLDRRLGTAEGAGGAPRWIDTPSVEEVVGNPDSLVIRMAVDVAGDLWLGTSHGLFRLAEDEGLERHHLEPGVCPELDYFYWREDARWRSCARGPGGTVWAIDGGRLLADGQEVLQVGLPSPAGFRGIAFDREGTVWVVSNSTGLYNLAAPRLQVLSREQGLLDRNVYPVHQDREGSVWLGDWRGTLTRIDGGTITAYPSPVAPDDSLYSIYHDPVTESLLFGSLHGLYEHRETGRRRLAEPRDLRTPPAFRTNAILRLGDGRLFVGTERGPWLSAPGMPKAGAWHGAELPGFGRLPIRDVVEEDDGTLWLATVGKGLAHWRGDRVDWLTQDDGLPSNTLRTLYLDPAGFLWIGTEDRGLARLHPSIGDADTPPRIDVVDQQDGLWHNGIHKIVEDADGRLWMSSNRGLSFVRRDQLEAFFDGRAAGIDAVGFTEADGMLNREGNGGIRDAGLVARDGRLWFPTQDGLVIADPDWFGAPGEPPPLFIEQVTVGDTVVGHAEGAVTLRAEQRSFAVRYTALAFRSPERVRFRYRLEGYDDAWIEAGDRRQAFFTRVPPDTYRFQVQVRSADGVWNRAGTALSVTVEPYVWETAWLRALVVCMLLTLAFAVVRGRERQQLARREELERMVAARTDELARERDTVAVQAEKLAEIDRQKSTLFADVSHELRTPLTLTLGPLNDLRHDRFGALPEAARDEVDRVHANASRLLELVNQILDVARFEAGGLGLRVVCRDLSGFVRRICDRFVSVAERRRLTFEANLPADPVWLYFDPEQLDKVVGNLLSNAVKLTPAEGRVTIVVDTSRDDRVVLTVTDTGPGIAARDLPHIFDRFYRGGGSQRYRHPGTGLGLSIVRDLVELHRGAVRVESEVGVGTTFTVVLRRGHEHFAAEQVVGEHGSTDDASVSEAAASLASARAIEAQPAERPAVPGSETEGKAVAPVLDFGAGEDGDRTTVLVVDDHPELRRYVCRHLDPRYRLLEAADAATALELAREHLPDLVVSDVMMPARVVPPPAEDAPEDGFGLCSAIKSDPELDWMPVVLLTAKATVDDKLGGLGTGADDYVVKPFDVRELALRVENLIASRRKLRARFQTGEVSPPRTTAIPLLDGLTVTAEDRAWLERVRSVIEETLDEEEFSVDSLSRALAIHRSQLHRRLKALTGLAPTQLIMLVRLERSAALLKVEAVSVSEAGYAVGFQSAAHFSRRFKERYGVTPSAFQRGEAAEAVH